MQVVVSSSAHWSSQSRSGERCWVCQLLRGNLASTDDGAVRSIHLVTSAQAPDRSFQSNSAAVTKKKGLLLRCPGLPRGVFLQGFHRQTQAQCLAPGNFQVGATIHWLECRAQCTGLSAALCIITDGVKHCQTSNRRRQLRNYIVLWQLHTYPICNIHSGT